MSSENAHTWTIPLNVSVSLGTPETGTLIESVGGVRQRAPIRTGEDFSEWWIFGGSKKKPKDVFADTSSRFSLSAFGDDAFSWQAALNAALCSSLAYGSAAKVASTAKGKWGFDTCDFESRDDTECFIATAPNAIVVSFRGTQEAGDWLINLNAATKRASYGYVHRGFYNAFHSVSGRLEQILGDNGAEHKQVIITGHSLGGATATIAAAEWKDKYPKSDVYTFGQPGVGVTAFRSFIKVRYGDDFRRFVNDDDIVPKVPPGFRHVGKLYHFDSGSGLSHESLAASTAMTDDTPTMSAAQFEALQAQLSAAKSPDPVIRERFDTRNFQEGFFPSFADHSIDRYIEKVLAKL